MDPDPMVALWDTNGAVNFKHTVYRDVSQFISQGQLGRTVTVRTTLSRPERTSVMFYQHPNNDWLNPDAVLDFGPSNSLGTIGMLGNQTMVHNYLQRVRGNSLARSFVASDGDKYTWSIESESNVYNYWTLRNSRDYFVAQYQTKDEREPSTRDELNISLPWEALTLQIVVTLTLVRHIELYNLR